MDMKQLFSDVSECCECPFSINNSEESGSYWKCQGSNEYSYVEGDWPCYDKELYKGKTLEDMVTESNARILAAQEHYYKKEADKKAKKEKQDSITESKRRTRSDNYEINKAISTLRSRIKQMEEAIDSTRRICGAVNFANNMTDRVNGKKCLVDEPSQIKVWEQQVITDKRKLNDLVKEREDRNKERRKINKNSKGK